MGDCTGPFPVTAPVPPARYTDSVAVDLNGQIIQVRPGTGRVALADGTVRVNNGPNAVDTLISGGGTGFPDCPTPACPSPSPTTGRGS